MAEKNEIVLKIEFIIVKRTDFPLSEHPGVRGPGRASLRPSEAKARKPYDKTEFRTEFSGS